MAKLYNTITPFDNLQGVFDQACPGDKIQLSEGVFRIKATVFVPGLTICGAGSDKTIIVWDDYANKIHADGKEYNTFRTWTLAVCADHVTMQDLAVVNDALHPETKGQEVALTVYADDFHMKNCRLTSTQDTLFVGPLPADLIERYDGFLPDHLRRDMYCRQYFDDCLIEGTVDFIFGCGETQFRNCEIRSLYDVRDVGYAAAPAHPLEQTEGFTFKNCRFTAEPSVRDGSIYLARPWRDYGLCRFEDCTYGSHISPLGFDKWNDTDRDRTARFYETPAVSGRVKWVK
ncbi:MAG: pectin esterase [Lachnospiraceae bacterium]|nr:pectin esterase [Lachnospiraceae bacterium]MBR1566557.1 pectin esterase [Oscillospiraceae bacterium]